MRRGAEAAEDILLRSYGIDVSKASKLNPLEDKDFVVLTERLSGDLSDATDDLDAADILDTDWVAATPAEREDRYKRLKEAILALVLLSVPATAKVLAGALTRIIRDTKAVTITEGAFKLSKAPSAADKISGAFLVSSQGSFTKAEYAKRSETVVKMVQEMVDKGLENGLDGAGIAALVTRAVELYLQARDVAYWEVTANALANRARTITQLNTFAEAGVARVRFVAVMDGVTCETCEFMNGREASVGALQGIQKKTEDLVDPEDILGAQPWLAHDTKGIYYKRGGQRYDVADDVSTEELVAEGLFLTPIHGRCRCKLEAIPAVKPA
jgi:hypothetical protein